MKRDHDFSSEYLKRCFRYNSKTGLLLWRKRPREHFRTTRGWNIFNKCYAGSEAGGWHPDGYLYLCLDGKCFLAHRAIWRMKTGRWPASTIDHKNEKRGDNRWTNLREASRSENQINSKPRGATAFRGVSYKPSIERWIARISRHGKRLYLGEFDTPEAASVAYFTKAKELYGKFARAA